MIYITYICGGRVILVLGPNIQLCTIPTFAHFSHTKLQMIINVTEEHSWAVYVTRGLYDMRGSEKSWNLKAGGEREEL